MNRIITLSIMVLLAAASFAKPWSMEVTNRVPVSIDSMRGLRDYATTNSYYFTVQLHEGMSVYYSASYGTSGEAGQAAGTLVDRDGKFFFKQEKNPTGQLLLPPGLVFNSGSDES